ncbi:sulfatase [Methylobacterium sp. Leaf104]|uniref:LTA synthase family protein n=1 Tax=Methylobacterium TaxID=407 RepID=UPI0006FDFA2D|nr:MULTISPECIES: LTA synthase family protein [Methylobacterium]KQP34976.1 sulfatase [Methylobacterium sp. Leaf104]MCI9882901.1 LTA synthase family protein [Methylobacterium goesingense]
MTLVLSLTLALLISLAIEAWEGAEARPVSQRPGDLAVRFAGYALVALFWFQFSWRPWLAGFSCVLTILILTVVSRLKRTIIGEPLVFSDFALLRQVPRHPELYYTRPLSDPRMAVPLLTGLALVAAWYAIEPTILPGEPSVAILAVAALPLMLISVAILSEEGAFASRLARLFPAPSLETDITRYGLPSTLVGYALRWRADRRTARAAALPTPPAREDTPVVVVVQLESFVDPVRLGGPPLPLMEIVRARAAIHGRLRVPAHGAYTMRTEHAVLTGLEPDDLGFGVFDPYLTHGGNEPTSLPLRARDAGFETVFVHPFHRDFFNRAEVVTRLGFDRLLMEDDFSGASRVGPYVGDMPLAERVLGEIRERTGPLFLYAITMENHGPWKPGRLPGIDDPLAQYLTHVANTGRAVETLIAGLEDLPATLCVFGDHAPALPNCRPGFGATTTDYAIFAFGQEGRASPIRRDIGAAELGRLLRDAVDPPPGTPSLALPPS